MAYSNEDGRLTSKPARGPNAGKEFEWESFKGLEFDPGTKRKVIVGRRQAPIFMATMGAEPKLSPEFTSAEEYMRWWLHLHGGQRPARNAVVLVSFTLTRPGVVGNSWRFLGCQFPAPGFKSGDNGVEMGKCEIPLLDAHLNGTTIYEQ